MNLIRCCAAGAFCLLLSGCFFSRNPEVDKQFYDIAAPQKKIPDRAVRFGSFRNLTGASRNFLYLQKDGRLRRSTHRSFLLSPEAHLERFLREALNSGPGAAAARMQLSAVIRRFAFDADAKEAVFDVEYCVSLERRSAVRGGAFRVPYQAGGEAGAMKKCFELSLPMLEECIHSVEADAGKVKK